MSLLKSLENINISTKAWIEQLKERNNGKWRRDFRKLNIKSL
jgi:hypothetical protein